MSSNADFTSPPAEWVAPDQLVPWPDNPKKPTRKRIGELAKVISELGFGSPIIARRSDRMVAVGHTRLLAAKKLGLEMIPVRYMELDDDQLAAMAIADNRLGEDQPWLPENLKEQLKKLDKRFDPLMLGFSEKEVERFLGRSALPIVPISDEDLPFDAPTPDGADESHGDDDEPFGIPSLTVSTGELWSVGPHRLLIDDSKKRDNVKRLFGKLRAEMMFTDPPYGVDYKATGSDKNALLGDLSQAEFPVSLDVATKHALSKDGRVYICGGNGNMAMVNSLFDHHFRMWPRLIMWVKDGFVMRQTGYHSRWEAIFHAWIGKGGGPEHWYGDRKVDDVWEVPRVPSSERLHPTEKPPELSQRAMRNHCKPGCIVYDPFAGSWSTAVGAHHEGRICYGIERDPMFARTAIERLASITGHTPGRVD